MDAWCFRFKPKKNEPEDLGLESCQWWDELDRALDDLEAEDAFVAQLVKMKVFGGLSVEEAGSLLGLSRSTAYGYWTFARSWFQVWKESDYVKPR